MTGRQYMDCKRCNAATGHTRNAGCILAVQDAAEANEGDGWNAINVASGYTFQLARDVLTMAANGGMPDTYWHTDKRIDRAAQVLGLSIDDAREWAEQEIERE